MSKLDIVSFAEQIMGVHLLESQKQILRTVQNDEGHRQFIFYNNRAGRMTLSRIIGEYLEYLTKQEKDDLDGLTKVLMELQAQAGRQNIKIESVSVGSSYYRFIDPTKLRPTKIIGINII